MSVRGTAAVAALVCTVGVSALVGCTDGSDGGAAEPEVSAATTSAGSLAPLPSASVSLPPPAPTPSVSRSPSGSPSPVPVTGPDQKLVTLTVSGGVAGVDRQLILRGDSTVHTGDRGEPQVREVGADRFREVRTLLADPALDEVPAVTRDKGARDLFQYTLSFEGRTVITDRSSDRPALDRLIDALSEWLPER
ncbi:hypothetical protein [Streptomyces resistomycificus]|uniref:Lipoprotein n=1 Tax=Streptomyces resistomycificus TaxID=67356 RepID=A0A0L8LNZ0_9ACTN|nr:hypothetical protein [Streptomyces resistomycificus]KOG39837.1 hypothetical protein ADK37_08520 [Streptomyces resistomycificus]KUO00879.1 hypothetical protein AQJ84_07800 [Streptomyces resistomycificus]